jgi:GDPmannose 4,6-dehydratase
MWLMLQQEKPDDYVIATGETHSVEEFLEIAFDHVGLDYQEYLVVEEKLFRPSEVHVLQGDASKAKRVLGWRPEVTFQQLVRDMVDNDLKWYKQPASFL